MCRLTVWGEMTSAWAISLLLNRCARSAKISCSRSVRCVTSSARPGGGKAALPVAQWLGSLAGSSGGGLAEGLQDLVYVAGCHTFARQRGKQVRHPRSQVDEDAHQAARLRQQDRLLQRVLRRGALVVCLMQQGLQRKDFDQKTGVACGFGERAQAGQQV